MARLPYPANRRPRNSASKCNHRDQGQNTSQEQGHCRRFWHRRHTRYARRPAESDAARVCDRRAVEWWRLKRVLPEARVEGHRVILRMPKHCKESVSGREPKFIEGYILISGVELESVTPVLRAGLILNLHIVTIDKLVTLEWRWVGRRHGVVIP